MSRSSLIVAVQATRRGITLVDLVVLLVLGALGMFVLLPYLHQALQRIVRTGCSFNLKSLGTALQSYESSHGGSLPVGSAYQAQPPSPWGNSWWIEILPHLTGGGASERWKSTTSPGSFSGETANPNYARSGGYALGTMTCPASPLPVFNDPARHVSAANRQSTGLSRGIAVPTYVAIAGSAPDMRPVGNTRPSGVAYGRTTRDGPRGVLSASGAFPPNRAVRIAALRDGQQHTLLLGEQSDWFSDRQYEPAVLTEARSAWPEGAYLGLEAPYGDLNPGADGVNGSGEARAFNITTLRYPLNYRWPKRGLTVEAVTPVPTRPAQAPSPAATVVGPSHNQGLFSHHAGGVNVLFADGHVRFLSDGIELPLLLRLATRDDGDYVDLGPE